MVSAAVGLHVLGWTPFAATFAAFFTRAFDQIRMAAISEATVNLVGSHAGVSIGEDGPSQMGLEDLAMMRTVHDSVVLYPACANATAKLTAEMAGRRGIRICARRAKRRRSCTRRASRSRLAAPRCCAALPKIRWRSSLPGSRSARR